MINQILTAIQEAGGKPFYVGGCVRDKLLGLTPKDFDIEVFCLPQARLEEVLAPFNVDMVGKSFGVYKVGDYDISLPRSERKTGPKHTDFVCEPDPYMSFYEASQRRDFTMNALYQDMDGHIYDMNNGQIALESGILHYTSSRFGEDPLRVLRGMQFCGRFVLEPSLKLVSECKKLKGEYATLPVERVWEEWKKWALKSVQPSKGLEFLKETEWIEHYPELQAIIGVEQDPTYHPEGDTFVHSLMVCDVAAQIAEREKLSEAQRLILMFAALSHDFGKATTTTIKNGRITSPGHAGETHLTTSFFS